MRPEGIEPSTFGWKDRRSLEPVKVPLTTELRALVVSLYPDGILTQLGFGRRAGALGLSRAGSGTVLKRRVAVLCDGCGGLRA